MKPSKRLLALFLSFAILLPLFAHTVSALDIVIDETALTAQTSADIVGLREENVKHFDMGNGVYQAIAYSHPVHELDENGVWQDIDFGLNLTASENGRVYANEAAGAEFAERLTANQPLFTLSEGDNAVSMTLRTASAARTAVAAEVTNPESTFQTVEDAQNAVFSSSVLYEDVLSGVDLEYIVAPDMVKENIIVKERDAAYSYAFTLNLTGLYPVVQGDGSIVLYEQGTGAEKYAIPAPFMYDALGNCSEDVSYTLSGSGENYILTVTANAAWINALGRAFPVTIDPTVTESTETVYDTYISSDEPTKNYGSNAMLWVRNNRITYIKTPSISIPSYATLDSAYLTAFYLYFDGVTSGSVGVSAHRITTDWNEATLTWNTASAMAENFGLETAALDAQVTYASIGATYSNPKQIDFTITDTVRGWLNGTYPNYGIGLKYVPGSANLSVVFRSSEIDRNYRPRITYTYHTNTKYFYFTNYYDSTFSSENVANISAALHAADVAYQSQFGVRLLANGAPTYRGDLADACTRGVNEQCSDKCGTTHHKDVRWISAKLFEEIQSSNQRVVYWTDRQSQVYCEHQTLDSCLPYDLIFGGTCIALVIDYRPVIHIMNLYPDAGDDDVDDLACMGINLIHEMAHTFGLHDRYEGYNHNDNGYQCVMEYYQYDEDVASDFYNAIARGTADAFCPNCAADLSSLINS